MHHCIYISLTRVIAKFHFDSMFTARDTAPKASPCRNGRNENNRTATNGSICLLIMSAKYLVRAKFTVMAAKKVASALDVLTSDGLLGCDEWSDNNVFEALVTDYFTGSVDDSSEESGDDDIGISYALI